MKPKKEKDSSEKYHSSEFLGKSQLFQMQKSPKHFKWFLDNPQNQTPALAFGTAFHCYVLEPERFAEEYIIVYKIDKRTKEGKELISNAESLGKKLITEEDMMLIQNMAESIHSTKYADTLLSGEHEISYYWEDEMTSIKVKCRPDSRRKLRNDKGIIVDIKTCESAATDDFMRDAIKYGYDLQSAQYKTGVELYEGYPHDFVFIAVEKKPPYAVNILQADDLFVQRGKDLYRLYLGLIADCRQNNLWDSYNGRNGMINNLGLPAWLLKEME